MTRTKPLVATFPDDPPGPCPFCEQPATYFAYTGAPEVIFVECDVCSYAVSLDAWNKRKSANADAMTRIAEMEKELTFEKAMTAESDGRNDALMEEVRKYQAFVLYVDSARHTYAASRPKPDNAQGVYYDARTIDDAFALLPQPSEYEMAMLEAVPPLQLRHTLMVTAPGLIKSGATLERLLSWVTQWWTLAVVPEMERQAPPP